MTLQYRRQLSLVVSNLAGKGLELGAMRVTFTVKRGDMQTPNSLDARVFNLSNETAQKINSAEFTQVQLSAGYNPTNDPNVSPALIFKGTVRQTRLGRINQLESYVDITAADGDEAYNFAPIFITVPAGNSNQPSQIAAAIYGALSVNAGNTSQKITQGYLPEFQPNGCIRGRVLYGMARDEARDHAWQNNCKWSIQDGAFTMVPYTSYIPGAEVPVISVATGLIGVPEQTQQGINIRTLLNANYKIGQLIKLDSQINAFRFGLDLPSEVTNQALAPGIVTDQQGLYYVMCANHTGDTRGQNWYTDLTCLAVDATQTINNQQQLASLAYIYPGSTSPNAIHRYGQP
jgi:baseplate hub protein gp41